MKNSLLFVTVLILYTISGIVSVELGYIGVFLSSFIFLPVFFLKNISQASLKVIVFFILIHTFFLITALIVKGFAGVKLGGNIIVAINFCSLIFGNYISKKGRILFYSTTIIYFVFIFFVSQLITVLSEQVDFYGTITGKVNYKVNSKNLIVYDFKTKKNINISNLKSKIIVLDYWNNNCAPCYKKFPSYKKLENKFKSNNNILFLTINSFEENNEILEGKLIMDSLKYNFKNYFQNRKISEKLNVQSFPTILVLKNGRIIFRGSVDLLFILDFIYLKP